MGRHVEDVTEATPMLGIGAVLVFTGRKMVAVVLGAPSRTLGTVLHAYRIFSETVEAVASVILVAGLTKPPTNGCGPGHARFVFRITQEVGLGTGYRGDKFQR
jgi:hypothetical protein